MSYSLKHKEQELYETIYDAHSACLYGIILKFTKDKLVAEDMLVETFRAFFIGKKTPEPVPGKTVFAQLLTTAFAVISKKIQLSKDQVREVMFCKNLQTASYTDKLDAIPATA